MIGCLRTCEEFYNLGALQAGQPNQTEEGQHIWNSEQDFVLGWGLHGHLLF